jgi:hypothetical protein
LQKRGIKVEIEILTLSILNCCIKLFQLAPFGGILNQVFHFESNRQVEIKSMAKNDRFEGLFDQH